MGIGMENAIVKGIKEKESKYTESRSVVYVTLRKE
jgi:hypothetical protein